MTTRAQRMDALEARVDELAVRIGEVEDQKESNERFARTYNEGLAQLTKRVANLEGPDDRREIRDLQLAVRRLELMVRGAVDREQDRSLGKPPNLGSVSIHAEVLAQRLDAVAKEEREKCARFVLRAARELGSRIVSDFCEGIANRLRKGEHL